MMMACGGSTEYRPLRTGDALPPYSARSLEGTDSVQVGQLEGPVLVNVWATWCIPCRSEMPALQQLHQKWQDDGLQVVGINIDGGRSDAPVRAFLDDLGITFRNLRDPEDRVTRVFRLVGVPETLLIDRDGRIAQRWVGAFDPLGEETAALVREALR
jgi:cytochrome c-type biogenesis protein